jgi:hypothetical protein
MAFFFPIVLSGNMAGIKEATGYLFFKTLVEDDTWIHGRSEIQIFGVCNSCSIFSC